MSPFFRPNAKGKARLAEGATLKAIRKGEYGAFYADYYDTAAARRRVRLPGCMTWDEAKKLERELQTEGFRRASGLHVPVRLSLTVEQLVQRYRDAEPAAQHRPRQVALNHLVRLLGRRAAAELTPADCQTALQALLREGYAPGTVTTQRIAASAVWTFGVEKLHALEANPWPKTTPPPPPLKAPRFLSDEAASALLLALKPRDRLLVYLLALTGARPGELMLLTWSDFLWDEGAHGALYIRKSGQRDLTKSGKARMVPLHPALRSLLDSLRGPPEALLFPTRKGAARKHWNAADLLRRAARRARVTLPPGFTAHDLRKTFATAIIRTTGNVVAAQRLLGHSSPRVTEAYYVGREGQVLEDVVGALRLVDGHHTDTRDLSTPEQGTRSTGKGQ